MINIKTRHGSFFATKAFAFTSKRRSMAGLNLLEMLMAIGIFAALMSTAIVFTMTMLKAQKVMFDKIALEHRFSIAFQEIVQQLLESNSSLIKFERYAHIAGKPLTSTGAGSENNYFYSAILFPTARDVNGVFHAFADINNIPEKPEPLWQGYQVFYVNAKRNLVLYSDYRSAPPKTFYKNQPPNFSNITFLDNPAEPNISYSDGVNTWLLPKDIAQAGTGAFVGVKARVVVTEVAHFKVTEEIDNDEKSLPLKLYVEGEKLRNTGTSSVSVVKVIYQDSVLTRNYN